MKKRLLQPFLLFGMIFINIIYNLVLLIILPIIFISGFFCDDNKFWKTYSWFFDMIPSMPENENENKNENKK